MSTKLEKAESKTFRLSDRLSVDIKVSAEGVMCVWDPEVPKKLTAKEMARYEKGRNAMIARWAELQGKSEPLKVVATVEVTAVLEADRRLHQIMSNAPKNKGTRNQLAGGGKSPPPENPPKTLDELGLDKDAAKEMRAVGTLSDEEFATVRDAGKSPTTVVRERREKKREERREENKQKLAVT